MGLKTEKELLLEKEVKRRSLFKNSALAYTKPSSAEFWYRILGSTFFLVVKKPLTFFLEVIKNGPRGPFIICGGEWAGKN